MAATCDYGAHLNSLIRDRQVVGISGKVVQKKLLSNAKLTLANAIEMTITSEATENKIRTMEGETRNSANEVAFTTRVTAKKNLGKNKKSRQSIVIDVETNGIKVILRKNAEHGERNASIVAS